MLDTKPDLRGIFEGQEDTQPNLERKVGYKIVLEPHQSLVNALLFYLHDKVCFIERQPNGYELRTHYTKGKLVAKEEYKEDELIKLKVYINGKKEENKI